MIPLLTVLCTCGGSFTIRTETLQLHPSGELTCNYMRTENKERITCPIKYKFSELYKAVEAGKDIYDARIEKQLTLGIQ